MYETWCHLNFPPWNLRVEIPVRRALSKSPAETSTRMRCQEGTQWRFPIQLVLDSGFTKLHAARRLWNESRCVSQSWWKCIHLPQNYRGQHTNILLVCSIVSQSDRKRVLLPWKQGGAEFEKNSPYKASSHKAVLNVFHTHLSVQHGAPIRTQPL